MTNVLLISPSPNLAGGISRWTKHILHYYDNNKSSNVNLELLSVDKIFIKDKFSFFNRLKRGVLLYTSLIFELKRRIKKKNYDAVHICSSSSISLIKDFLILKLTKKNKLKSILHFRFGRIPELSIQKNWEWNLLCKVVNLSTITVVIDQNSYDTLISCGFKNIQYIPNPISDKVLDIVEANKNICSISNEIVFVGQIIPSKGIFELIDACKGIPNIRLRMMGVSNDNIEKILKARAGNDSSWLDIIGEIEYEEVIKKMMTAGVFVLPTYTEGFPNVILESMACGCPIIATNVGAIPEMLNGGPEDKSGIVIEPKNVNMLKKAILKMINDREFAKKCGYNAKKRVVELYSMNSVGSKWEQIWKN